MKIEFDIEKVGSRWGNQHNVLWVRVYGRITNSVRF